MTFEPPERLNIADLFLDERVREGRGARPAIRADQGTRSYAEVQALAAQDLVRKQRNALHRHGMAIRDHFGDGAAMPMLAFVRKFRKEFEAHIEARRCPVQGSIL